MKELVKALEEAGFEVIVAFGDIAIYSEGRKEMGIILDGQNLKDYAIVIKEVDSEIVNIMRNVTFFDNEEEVMTVDKARDTFERFKRGEQDESKGNN